MKTFYETNPDFRRFVDANAKAYGKTPEYIMETPTTREYYKSLQRGGCNESKSKNGRQDHRIVDQG